MVETLGNRWMRYRQKDQHQPPLCKSGTAMKSAQSKSHWEQSGIYAHRRISGELSDESSSGGEETLWFSAFPEALVEFRFHSCNRSLVLRACRSAASPQAVWHFSAALPDSAALPSMVCESHGVLRALRSAPGEPTQHNAHTYITPLPSPPIPSPSTLMLPLGKQAHPDFLHDHLNVQKLQTTADARTAGSGRLAPPCS